MKKNTISFLVAKDVLLLTILLYIYNGGGHLHCIHSRCKFLSLKNGAEQEKSKPSN